MKRIPEVVEERDELPGGARRPSGEAVEVGGQCKQGILAAAGGSEDGGNMLANLLRCRQIILSESHVDAAPEADVARVEGVSLELGGGGIGQKGLEGGVGNTYMKAIFTILPTTVPGAPRTLRLQELQLVVARVGVVPQLAEEGAAIRVLGLV
ncbi:hypothetical protein BOVATA_024410 [Babesia ovata]|uniref:Uncharacterized protein n=1 Tax=Babesia ovata TaxID=189622 RepID=A0A2H6KD82_9APIC|nr:uncharacterized protein BOVATA_024410 [Babesia ovata]GBE60948.1 hypothetical protein BOVATA_024410 [Babesia ovata]